jgi:hypothetical protein
MLDKFFLIVGVFADESNYLSFVKWKHGILSSINRDLNFWEKDQENVPRFKHIFTSVKNWIPTLPSGFYIFEISSSHYKQNENWGQTDGLILN